MNVLIVASRFAYIFSIWWYSMPVMLKGYIDRVWNDGVAYGSNKLQHDRILRLGLAGASREHLEKRQYGIMLKRQLNVGIAAFAGSLGFRYHKPEGDVFE